VPEGWLCDIFALAVDRFAGSSVELVAHLTQLFLIGMARYASAGFALGANTKKPASLAVATPVDSKRLFALAFLLGVRHERSNSLTTSLTTMHRSSSAIRLRMLGGNRSIWRWS
jgi:hypothetical protein